MAFTTNGARLLQTRLNAALGWGIVLLYIVVLTQSVVAGALAQAALTTGVLAVVVVPPIVARSPRVMVPWELLVVASIPVVTQVLPLPAPTTTFAQYFAVAAFALIVIVELHAFTELSVTHGLAVALVTLTTLASAGFWSIIRFQSDRFLGTEFLTTNAALMQEFIAVILAGVIAGVVFAVYFRRGVYQVRRRVRG